MTRFKPSKPMLKAVVWAGFFLLIALLWFTMELLSEVPEELLEEEALEVQQESSWLPCEGADGVASSLTHDPYLNVFHRV